MMARRRFDRRRGLPSTLAGLGAAVLIVACLTTPASVLKADTRPDPKAPPGSARPGTPVALIGPGADYTQPGIAAMLDRDGEGEPIAWDFADNDARPYAASGPGNQDILLLAANTANARLILIRQPLPDPKAFAEMIVFIVQTPARIILWSSAQSKRPDWPTFEIAVRRLPHLLFVIPEPGSKVSPLADLPNLLVVAAPKQPLAISARQAAVIATARAADLLAAEPGLTSAALKARLLVKSR